MEAPIGWPMRPPASVSHPRICEEQTRFSPQRFRKSHLFLPIHSLTHPSIHPPRRIIICAIISPAPHDRRKIPLADTKPTQPNPPSLAPPPLSFSPPTKPPTRRTRTGDKAHTANAVLIPARRRARARARRMTKRTGTGRMAARAIHCTTLLCEPTSRNSKLYYRLVGVKKKRQNGE